MHSLSKRHSRIYFLEVKKYLYGRRMKYTPFPRVSKLCQAKELGSIMFYSTCVTIVIVIESFHILDNPRIKGMVCRTKRVRVSESCFAMRCVLPPSRWSSAGVGDTTGRMAFAWSFLTDFWMNKIVWIKSPDMQNADYKPGWYRNSRRHPNMHSAVASWKLGRVSQANTPRSTTSSLTEQVPFYLEVWVPRWVSKQICMLPLPEDHIDARVDT